MTPGWELLPWEKTFYTLLVKFTTVCITKVLQLNYLNKFQGNLKTSLNITRFNTINNTIPDKNKSYIRV